LAKSEFLKLDNLNGYDFEDLMARILRKMNYSNVKVTQRSGDKGKDILATYDDGSREYPVVVECKHMKSVGRPVIQKLQGALLHEKGDSPFIKGIVATSGTFSNEAITYVDEVNGMYSDKMHIDLIDGLKLKELCKKYGIKLVNGKIQVVTEETVPHISKDEMKSQILSEFDKIVGSEKVIPEIKTWKNYKPCFYMNYDLNSQVSTQVGCIYDVRKNGEVIALDGSTGKPLTGHFSSHFITPKIKTQNIPESEFELAKPFEYNENDLEGLAFEKIITDNTKKVTYSGKNNVSYDKVCSPSKRDISIKSTRSFYLPSYSNNIKVLNHSYSQKALVNGNNILKTKDELTICKECGKNTLEHGISYICPVCGKIMCKVHAKLDYLDNSPVCSADAWKKKLYLQNLYFSSSETLNTFENMWLEMGTLQKIWTDKALVQTTVGGLIFLIIAWRIFF